MGESEDLLEGLLWLRKMAKTHRLPKLTVKIEHYWGSTCFLGLSFCSKEEKSQGHSPIIMGSVGLRSASTDNQVLQHRNSVFSV